MLPLIGEITIYIAVVGLMSSILCYFFGLRSGAQGVLAFARRSFYVASAAVGAGSALLLWLILTHDFSVAYVAQYSSSDLPLIYLVSAFWAGQMGTFLLWLLFIVVCGLALARNRDRLSKGAMLFLGLVGLSMALIFLKKSPFELLAVTPLEGSGLNPLLQDFWMALHPPIMFVGYACAAVPFAYALSALFFNRLDDWEEKDRFRTLLSWLSVGVSLIMGGYWAYKVLGWGGYWAWDPVENSSLIPWLLLTAQLHVLVIRRTRVGFSKFSPILVCVTFLSVLYGTFLTRSGVLADFSVHSFVDLGLNNFLIISMVFFTLLTVVALQIRWSQIKSTSTYSTVISTEYLLAVGVIALFLGAFMTLGGTSAPLLTRFTETPAAVEIGFYATTMAPVALVLLLALAIFPFLRWRSGVRSQKALFIGFALFVCSFVLLEFLLGGSVMVEALLAAGVWALYSNLCRLRELIRLRLFPSAPIIHIGFALLLIGATASSALKEKHSVVLREGTPTETLNHRFTYVGYQTQAADTVFEVVVASLKSPDDVFMARMTHENKDPDAGLVRKPHIQKGFFSDLYISPLGAETAGGQSHVTVNLYKNEQTAVGSFGVNMYEIAPVRDAPGKPARKIIYRMHVEKDGVVETLDPAVEMVGAGLVVIPDTLADGSGSVTPMLERSERGGILFAFDGAFLSESQRVTQNALAVEITTEPLVSLVWIGSLFIFFGGGAALRSKVSSTRIEKLIGQSEMLSRPAA